MKDNDDNLRRVWQVQLKQQGLSTGTGRGPRKREGARKKHFIMAYGHTYNDGDCSTFGQEFYSFPDLDPQIEQVRLMSLLWARRQVYRHPAARIRPNRITPRRSLGSGPGTKVNLTDNVVVGYVPASASFRTEERNYGRKTC